MKVKEVHNMFMTAAPQPPFMSDILMSLLLSTCVTNLISEGLFHLDMTVSHVFEPIGIINYTWVIPALISAATCLVFLL